jgi:predicted MFS family arabinose efflux permease
MGKRSRSAMAADLAVTVMGVGGFLGFLVAARMDDANTSPFDVMAYAWFFGFLVLKLCLPWFRSKRIASKRKRSSDSAPLGNALDAEPRWYRS